MVAGRIEFVKMGGFGLELLRTRVLGAKSEGGRDKVDDSGTSVSDFEWVKMRLDEHFSAVRGSHRLSARLMDSVL